VIRAERKPVSEIAKMLAGKKKILVVGCKTCVAICHAGGEKEVAELVSALRLVSSKGGLGWQLEQIVVERQCEKEWVRPIEEKIKSADAVVSLACGLGAQTLSDMYPEKQICPGVNTMFLGVPEEQGVFVEKCLACGECVMFETGGICPIARCAKSMRNGACGGSSDGKCEVNSDTDCAWYMIYERLKLQGRLDLITKFVEPKDWAKSHSGGRRKIVRKDLLIQPTDRTGTEVKK
jgi:ferredoxin